MPYQHVIVVGVDGAGAFFQSADTPHFDRIFANGAQTFRALSEDPTISAECWGSMLTGVAPALHGRTNHILKREYYPFDSPFPTVFARLREAFPKAELGAFCEWEPLIHGLVENGLDAARCSASDEHLTKLIGSYIRDLLPTFLFIQIDCVDEAGHRFGYGSAEHIAQIETVDGMLGEIYSAVSDAGILGDTLFCVIADHGGTPLLPGMEEATHGGLSDAEKFVTFAAAGKTVCPKAIPKMRIRDLAAIVLYALGVPAPEYDPNGWTSEVPEGIFSEK